MVYCGRGEAWGIKGMGNAGLIKDVELGLRRARGAGIMGSEIKSGLPGLTVKRPFRPCPFCLSHSRFLAVYQTCSTLLLYTFPTHAFVSAIPSARSALPPPPPLPCTRKGNSNASFTGILSPIRCHTQSLSSASQIGFELLMVLHFSENVLSHFLASVMAISSACECFKCKDPVRFFLLYLASVHSFHKYY